MTRGRLSLAFVLCITLAPAAAAQSIPISDTTRAVEPTKPKGPPPAPPRFAHDDYFLKYTAAFASYTYRLKGNYPGPVGMTGGSLADRIPGVEYRSAGALHQPSEFDWFGGDGQAVGFHTDRFGTGAELLGYPPSGAIDPVTLPPFSDTLYLTTAPLLSATPALITDWRDPELLDSTEAVARHTNGPDGFSHTGGRFRSQLGRGWEIDGTGFRTFSDGQQANTGFDGHRFDIEFRRTFGRYPARIRFLQNRANRFESFRWQPSSTRAHLFYVLSDLRFEVARPDSAGEWLFGLALHHDDQKLDTGLAHPGVKWFTRTYTASLSRLWRGPLSGWLAVSGTQQQFAQDSGFPDHQRGELSGGLWKTAGAIDLTATAAVTAQTDYDLLWRAAGAATWHLSRTSRVTLAAGRSLAPPAAIRRMLPVWGDTSGTIQALSFDTTATIHETASLAINHNSKHLQLTLMAAAGRSRDLFTWSPTGDGASIMDVYGLVKRERKFAGVSAIGSWHPFEILKLSGSVDQTVTNEWAKGGYPVFAPDSRWWARVEFPMYVDKYNLHLTPMVYGQGAARGTLPEDYGILCAGFDFRIKELTIFWRDENLLDLDYRTGGAGYALDRHYTYGIRWEFWN